MTLAVAEPPHDAIGTGLTPATRLPGHNTPICPCGVVIGTQPTSAQNGGYLESFVYRAW
jgi:hypothetical protein